MADGSVVLKGGFYVRQMYDFSKAYGLSFNWWGSDLDNLVDFRLETPTGNFITSFPDGPASWY